jgi:hypothetical protein
VTEEVIPNSATAGATPPRQYTASILSSDGSFEDITDDARLVGAQEFLDAWQRSVDTPDELRATYWTNVDGDHPVGRGAPAYRVVYKTLRMIPYPQFDMTWPNLRVHIRNGDVSRGQMVVERTIQGRSPRHRVLPEHGRLLEHEDRAQYVPCLDTRIEIRSQDETLRAISYVEIVWHLEGVDAADYEASVARGRRAVAPLKALLDLKFGPRLLAMPLTEEIGEAFEDGHWNRRDQSGLFTTESQASIRQIQVHEIADELAPLILAQQTLPPADQARLTLACVWYWRADAEPDRVVRFISWWIVVESLEMRDSNPRHVMKRLATIFSNDGGVWGKLIGKLFTLRGRLVHGQDWEVPEEQLQRVELVARVLLNSRLLGEVPDGLRSEVLAAAAEAASPDNSP